MVERQIIARGVKSPAVLDAMRNVPRHTFVPEVLQGNAYDDSPLPIGLGQTISQPYIVAYMTEQLAPFPGMKVLEVGTGSGYQAAILAYLGCEVYTIELLEEHADKARQALAGCNFSNVLLTNGDASTKHGSVTVKHGNGYEGLPEHAPFDAIIVTAAPEVVPPALISQLRDNGRMIIPVGSTYSVQSLMLLTKDAEVITEKELLLVRFVPLVEI